MASPLDSPCYSSYSSYSYCDMGSHTQQQLEVKREKRRYRARQRSPATVERAKTVRRDKANARERRRMNSLNDALEKLRDILPQTPDEPKMTKIETLKVAQTYIAHLSSILTEECAEVKPMQHISSMQAESCTKSSPNFPTYPSMEYYYDNTKYAYS